MDSIQKNRGTGAGGAKTNETGLNFEENIYLKDWIESAGYRLKLISKPGRSFLFEIYKSQKLVGYYGRQGQIYNALKLVDQEKFNSEHIKKTFSKRIVPDSFIISLRPRQLTIFEKKWQQTPGSVDEKIQTAPYKLHMFEKLLRGSNINCQYQYILSKWFQDKSYRNIKEYYENKNNYKTKGRIKVFVENENLETIDINDYFK